MKKNLVSIGILALLIVNIVLTAIMMFSVMSTNKKTAALVTNIAAAVNLDLASQEDSGEEVEETISIANIATASIDEMTIPLQTGSDGKSHYALVEMTLSMNTAHEDYATYGEDVVNKVDLIKGIINRVVSQYTVEELKANNAYVCNEILTQIQQLYGSDFIFDITFSKALYQ